VQALATPATQRRQQWHQQNCHDSPTFSLMLLTRNVTLTFIFFFCPCGDSGRLELRGRGRFGLPGSDHPPQWNYGQRHGNCLAYCPRALCAWGGFALARCVAAQDGKARGADKDGLQYSPLVPADAWAHGYGTVCRRAPTQTLAAYPVPAGVAQVCGGCPYAVAGVALNPTPRTLRPTP